MRVRRRRSIRRGFVRHFWCKLIWIWFHTTLMTKREREIHTRSWESPLIWTRLRSLTCVPVQQTELTWLHTPDLNARPVPLHTLPRHTLLSHLTERLMTTVTAAHLRRVFNKTHSRHSHLWCFIHGQCEQKNNDNNRNYFCILQLFNTKIFITFIFIPFYKRGRGQPR